MARDVSDDTKPTIGEILKHLRQDRLWSQAELARLIGTTPVSVGRWENNITRPNLYFQQQLCKLFSKSPEELGFVPQSRHGQSPQSNDQLSEVEPYQPQEVELEQPEQVALHEHATGTLPVLAPVHRTSSSRMFTLGHIVVWNRRSFFFVMTCLSLFLLLSMLFWYVRQNMPLSAAQHPSCQALSSHESAAAIYAQVMCRHPLFTSELNRQDGLRWDENELCRFEQGGYHVLLPTTTYVTECFSHAAPFGPNFALQVDITILKGYSGGLVFRAQGPSSNWDVIVSRIPIDVWGQYNFDLGSTTTPCHLSKDPIAPTYCYSPHGTITYGTGVTNTMMMVALGSQVYLYVNGFFIDQAQTPASSPLTGFLGVFANGSRVMGDVVFRHLQIWSF